MVGVLRWCNGIKCGWFEVWRIEDEGPKIFPAIHWFEFKVGKDQLSRSRIVKGKKVLGQHEFRETMLPLGHMFYIISDQEGFMLQLKNIIEPTLHIAKQIWPNGSITRK